MGQVIDFPTPTRQPESGAFGVYSNTNDRRVWVSDHPDLAEARDHAVDMAKGGDTAEVWHDGHCVFWAELDRGEVWDSEGNRHDREP